MIFDRAWFRICTYSLGAIALSLAGAGVRADETPLKLTIKNHQFHPNPLIVPAAQRQLVLIDNQDESAEEFESDSLHREKLLPAKTVTRLFIGPLKPGTYEYFGDFHPELSKGQIRAQ